MGRFFSFKLYLIINDKEEIQNLMFILGNTDEHESRKVFRKRKREIICRQGYIRQALFENLSLSGI